MEKTLKGTKTERNLWTSFAGESQARNKYDFFASIAKKEGFEVAGAALTETALQEKEHAKIWFKELSAMPASSVDALLAAAAGEREEWKNMYAGFAKEAKEEGFEHLAFLFEKVGAIEKTHEEKFVALADKIKSNAMFASDKPAVWICRNCGHHTAEGKSAPDLCPVCSHPKAYFEKQQ